MEFKYKDFRFNVPTKDLLFLIVTGSHAYGYNKKKSDLDIVGMTSGSSFRKYNPDTKVCIMIYSINHFIKRLLGGVGYFLEDLYSYELYKLKPEAVDLRKVVINNLSKQYGNWYLNQTRRIIDSNYWKDTVFLIKSYRFLMSGLVLMKERKIEYYLLDLFKKFPSLCPKILNFYKLEQELPNKLRTEVQGELISLKNRLEQTIESADLPWQTKRQPFIDWYRRWKIG